MLRRRLLLAAVLPALEPTRFPDPNPLEWVHVSPAEALQVDVLPTDEPLTQYLQGWVDRADLELRRRYPERFAKDAVPQPEVRILKSDDTNAFVQNATVCYRVNIRFPDLKVSPAISTDDQLMAIDSQGKVGIFARSSVACVDRMLEPVDPEFVMRTLRESQQIRNCRFEVQDNALLIHAPCQPQGSASIAEVQGIMLMATTQQLVVGAGFIRLFKNEEPLINTLLHELGHFYRSHGALNKKSYPYFYRISADNHLRSQPQADSQMDALGKSLLALPGYRTQEIPGQYWHSEFFSYTTLAVNKLIQPACGAADSECYKACEPLLALWSDPENARIFGSFPQAQLNESGLRRYFSWESSYRSCLEAIRVVDPAALRKVYWKAQIPEPLPDDYRLFEAARSMNEQFLLTQKAERAVLQQALDDRIGYYTTEEEADNLALSWLPWVGLPAESALDHWAIYAESRDQLELDSDYNFNWRRCRPLYTADPHWTWGGSERPVPIGGFSDPHHSNCFRLWNLDKQLPERRQDLGADQRNPQLYQRLRVNLLEQLPRSLSKEHARGWTCEAE